MANINLRRFVDVDILYHSMSTVQSTRDVVVLLTAEGTLGNDDVFASYAEFVSGTAGQTMTMSDKYAKVFFDNGGIKLRVIQGITSANLQSAISSLADEYIIVAYTGSYSDMKTAAQARENSSTIYGINQKILLGRTNDSSDTDVVKNFAVKYSSIDGAEMTIAAYLSNINVYRSGSIADYAFTKEILTAEPSDDTTLGACLANNLNVDMYLSSAVRNLGGNAKDGYDLVNAYVLIILHQTLTERLLTALVQKLKGSAGLASLGTVISQELGKYADSGYLATDKSWSDNDLVITYNNQSFTIIRQGEQLLLGYKVVILPYSSLSDADKAARKTPPIYVVLADSYGIRSITVNGEVI